MKNHDDGKDIYGSAADGSEELTETEKLERLMGPIGKQAMRELDEAAEQIHRPSDPES